MKTYVLMVGDEEGLRGANEVFKREPERYSGPKGYSGPTGNPANPDPLFVEEVIRRRSALHISAVQLSCRAGYSRGYLSMVEKGVRYASEEAKSQFRKILDEREAEDG